MVEMTIQSVVFADLAFLKPPVEVFTDTIVLSRAITAGTLKEVKLLLEKGCDPNQPCGTWGMRPLMIAQYVSSKKKQQHVVQLLLQFGANPSLTDSERRNCLMYACALRSCESISTMLQASEYDFYDTDWHGNTLLHLCAMVGDPDILKVVLKYGSKYRCDLNSRNRLSLTALLIAIFRQRRECTVLLHECGATPRFTANDFQSILSIMEESSGVKNLESMCKFDLLLRIVSDSESVSEQLEHHLHTLHTVTPSFTADKSQKHVQAETATDPQDFDNPPEDYRKRDSSTHRPHTFSYSKSKFSGQTSPEGVGCRSASLQAAEQPLTYMDSIEDLLSCSFDGRRSASYRDSQACKHEVNDEWVKAIKMYCHNEPCKRNTAPAVESIAKTSSQLARAISTPSNAGAPLTGPTPPLGRPRSLSRSTTSPNLFSKNLKGRKLASSSSLGKVMSTETPN